MSALDPIYRHPQFTGPTLDTNREQQAPTWRAEPHQIVAAPCRPIQLTGRPRPMTSRVVHEMKPGRVIVTAKIANQNPANAGEEGYTSVVGVSDPGALAEDGTTLNTAPRNYVKPVLMGAVLGALAGIFLAR